MTTPTVSIPPLESAPMTEPTTPARPSRRVSDGERRGTRARAVRVPDAVWDPAMALAAVRDEALSDVMRAALVAYIATATPAEKAAITRARKAKQT